MEAYRIERRYWKEWEWYKIEFITLESAITYCFESLQFYKAWRIFQGDEEVYSMGNMVCHEPPKRALDVVALKKYIKFLKNELKLSYKTLAEIRKTKNFLDDRMLAEGYAYHTAILGDYESRIHWFESLLKSIETTAILNEA